MATSLSVTLMVWMPHVDANCKNNANFNQEIELWQSKLKDVEQVAQDLQQKIR